MCIRDRYGSDPQWGNPIANFIDMFNQQNPWEKYKSGSIRVVNDTENG